MFALVEAVVFTVGLLAACVGIGSSILRWAKLEEPRELDAPRPISAGVSAAFGLALLIALGGLGMVARIPVTVSVVAFSLVGLALLVARLVRAHPRWAAVWVAVLAVEFVALGLVLLTQAGVGVAFPYNPCDDILAYLPEARRLLITRTLLEPWSTRRLQNFGGQTFLQASYIRFLGKDALALTETLLPVGLLWLLISTALRRPLTRLLSLVPLLFLPFFDVPRANTAGALSPVPLLVALGALVLVLRLASQRLNLRGRVVTAVAIGVTAAAVVALRTNVAPAAAIIAVVGAATVPGSGRDRFRSVGVCVFSGIVAFAPWSIAMWESSGTPLYPLFHGNENPRVPSVGGNTSVSLSDFFSNLWDFASKCTYPAALLVLLLVVVVARRVIPKAAPIAALMIAAGLVNVVMLTVNLSLVPATEFDRYTFPLAAGVLFFVLRSALVRLDDEPSVVHRSALLPGLLTVVALFAFFWYGTSRPQTTILAVRSVDDARAYVDKAADIAGSDEHLTPDNAVRSSRRVLAAVPGGSRSILAVGDPDSYLTAGADLQSMDQPGSVAPGGRFPFFTGPEAKVRTLRGDGYDVIIVTPSKTHPCFERNRIEAFTRSRIAGYRELAPYVLDFFDDMDALVERYPDAAGIVDGTYVIDLRRIPGTTPRDAEGHLTR